MRALTTFAVMHCDVLCCATLSIRLQDRQACRQVRCPKGTEYSRIEQDRAGASACSVEVHFTSKYQSLHSFLLTDQHGIV